jgi:flagellar basal-body rod modification protein FlgD
MTSPIPLVSTNSSASGTGSTSSSPQPTASNTLGPNSFITLLTAQLKAQDPLNPTDPDQLVNELTSINSLQQLVQIKADLDTLIGALPSGQSSNGTTAGSSSATTSVAPAAAKLNYLVNSQINSQLNSNSQSF